MKKTLIILTAVAVLGFATLAFAHGGGYGWGGGHMMGWGVGNDYTKDTSEYLDKTSGLRREFHEKRFDYMEALRAGDEEKAEKIATELDEISKALYKEAPKGRKYARGGYGPGQRCW